MGISSRKVTLAACDREAVKVITKSPVLVSDESIDQLNTILSTIFYIFIAAVAITIIIAILRHIYCSHKSYDDDDWLTNALSGNLGSKAKIALALSVVGFFILAGIYMIFNSYSDATAEFRYNSQVATHLYKLDRCNRKNHVKNILSPNGANAEGQTTFEKLYVVHLGEFHGGYSECYLTTNEVIENHNGIVTKSRDIISYIQDLLKTVKGPELYAVLRRLYSDTSLMPEIERMIANIK
ncbi:hypothetical protein NECID01_1635 [Nematocida sp. AWRm77]|nr:hypothetical protein NECID01_1635 [Nematocida sp. AWRm77]